VHRRDQPSHGLETHKRSYDIGHVWFVVGCLRPGIVSISKSGDSIMSGWMILWVTLLFAGFTGMVGLLLFVTVGAFRELRESLEELRAGDSSE
jgi:hypothetical protein